MKTITIILILAVATSCRSEYLDNVEINALSFTDPSTSESEITPVGFFPPAVLQTQPKVEPYPTPVPPAPEYGPPAKEYGPPAQEYGLPPSEYYHQSAPAPPLVFNKSPIGAHKPYYYPAPAVPFENKAPTQPIKTQGPPPVFQVPPPGFQVPPPVFQAAPPAFQAKAPLAPVKPQAVPMLPLLPLPPMPMMGD